MESSAKAVSDVFVRFSLDFNLSPIVLDFLLKTARGKDYGHVIKKSSIGFLREHSGTQPLVHFFWPDHRSAFPRVMLNEFLASCSLGSTTTEKEKEDWQYNTKNKAGYTATEVACGWAGAKFEVTRPLRQEQWGQRNKI